MAHSVNKKEHSSKVKSYTHVPVSSNCCKVCHEPLIHFCQGIVGALQIAKDTSKFKALKYDMIRKVPRIDFTETTERIFSTSIETINTVGNVLFTENVAEFYHARKFYKTVICDSIKNRIVCDKPFVSLKGTLDFDYSYEVIMSGDIRMNMQNLFAQCKQMMDVNDEEIEAYRLERKQLQEESADEFAKEDSIAKKILQRDQELRAAKKKLKLE